MLVYRGERVEMHAGAGGGGRERKRERERTRGGEFVYQSTPPSPYVDTVLQVTWY